MRRGGVVTTAAVALLGLGVGVATGVAIDTAVPGYEVVCRDFRAHQPGAYVVCVPAIAPSGAPLTGQVQEDGSTRYADGTVRDAERGWVP